MDELCCFSRDFLLLFFFSPLCFYPFSFYFSSSVVYWNGFIGNIVDSAEIYCAEELCIEEWKFVGVDGCEADGFAKSFNT